MNLTAQAYHSSQVGQRESEQPSSDIVINIEPADDSRSGHDVEHIAPVSEQSYPSTIYDRGNSERLREINHQDPVRDSVQGSESEVAGTGSRSKMEERLHDAIKISKDGKKFLPLNRLEAIVTKMAMEHELTQYETLKRNASTLAEDIYRQHEFQESNRRQYASYQKIFAILVLIDKVQYITHFLDEKIRDSDLPLKEHKIGSTTCLVARHVELDPKSEYPLRTDKEWTLNEIGSFETQQWIVCAPFFATASNLGERVYLYSLSTRDVLPFVSPGTDDQNDPQYLYQGTFSNVRRVKIHQSHHNFSVHQVRIDYQY